MYELKNFALLDHKLCYREFHFHCITDWACWSGCSVHSSVLIFTVKAFCQASLSLQPGGAIRW